MIQSYGALIPNVTDELASLYFITQLHTEHAVFFEFLQYRNYRLMAAMIENVKQFKKTEEEYELWKEKSTMETSGWDQRQD